MLDILETVNAWLNDNRRIALATVVETWGSSPRQAGAKMAVASDMAMIGSVSGGCVETAVVEQALESLEDGKPRLLHYGVSDDTAWDVGLACGGKISVYVEPLDAEWWKMLAEHIQQNRSVTSVTILTGEHAGQKILTGEDGVVYTTLSDGQRDTLAQNAAAQTNTKRLKIAENDVLVDVHSNRPHLIIIGGAHVAMALKNFAFQLGFRVSLIDPRKAFATKERFPDVEFISHKYPDKALPQLGLDHNSYIVILTHDPKIDDPALRVALPSHAPYIGILSSMRTHEQRIERLTAAGIDPKLIERVHVPIGIDIGAQSPEEIALCIMAEIVAVKNKGTTHAASGT
jgi:xanthine dehydrogenase accessory factor